MSTVWAIMISDLFGSMFPYLFLVLGVGLIVFGVRGLRQQVVRRRQWREFPGQAVDYVWDTRNNTSVQYWVLEWIGDDGVQRTARNPYGVSGGTLREFPFPVRVLVDPDDPTRAQVARGAHSGLLGTMIMIPVGALFTIVGVLVLANSH